MWVWSEFGMPELWPITGEAPNVHKTHNKPRNRISRPGQEARHTKVYPKSNTVAASSATTKCAGGLGPAGKHTKLIIVE